MKKVIIWIILIAFVISGLAAAVFSQSKKPSGIIKAPAAPVISDNEYQAELARRRRAVLDKMTANSTMILFSTEPRKYTGDVDYVYRQENNLFYLTGLNQNNISLVLTKTDKGSNEYLFVPDRSYFSEIWNGDMYSREQAASISGLKDIRSSADFAVFLKGFSNKLSPEESAKLPGNYSTANIYLLLPASPGDRDALKEYTRELAFAQTIESLNVENARPIFDELRLVKSPLEIKIMQHAIDITTEAQMRAMSMVGSANWEYEVQAEVEYTFRRRNADFWGYPSIVGCGHNATTLHYVESQSPVKKGDLLLMDVGAEYKHYTADVTRTFPVNGKFTKEQAEIYQIVYDAQEAVAKATKPGVEFAELGMIANRTVTEGLFKLGLITEKSPAQTRIWFMHGLGHWLGMNVHDVGDYSTPLKAGMIYTNEPGIYIRAGALDNLPDNAQWRDFKKKVGPVFEKYKNIGVRIEDDMLVTETGVEWMTKALPRKLSDIETFMAANSLASGYSFNRPNWILHRH